GEREAVHLAELGAADADGAVNERERAEAPVRRGSQTGGVLVVAGDHVEGEGGDLPGGSAELPTLKPAARVGERVHHTTGRLDAHLGGEALVAHITRAGLMRVRAGAGGGDRPEHVRQERRERGGLKLQREVA